MTKCTSKASYNEIKETGTEMSQSDKILEIISIGGDWSLQEIMAAYRAKWGNIELSSVSARVNKLKDPDTPLIFEGHPRKCSITEKTINPLTTTKQRTLGEYNAWVAKGKTREERNKRLDQVPDSMKDKVKSHVTTVFQLRNKK